MKLLKTMLLGSAVAFAMAATAGSASATTTIALLVKNLGNGFFDAANKGAEQAAAELGDVKIIYTGPTQATPEGQIDIINQLIAQGVNAIAVSANDADALVPALKKAMDQKITVISFDSGVSQGGREMNLYASAPDQIGDQNLKMANDLLNGQKGDVAILSATSTATNQNAWIDIMKKDVGQYPNVNLTTVVYGDDKQDKSYTEAQGLITSDPNLKVIIAPTTVGIAAAAQYVEDNKLVGKVLVTGLGLPSEMINHVKSGAAPQFALWNPIDLGYAATTIAYNLATGKEKAVAGGTLSIGKLGTVKLDDTLSGPMARRSCSTPRTSTSSPRSTKAPSRAGGRRPLAASRVRAKERLSCRPTASAGKLRPAPKAMTSNPTPALETIGISKSFPGVRALEAVNLRLYAARSRPSSARTAPANRRW